MPKIACYFLAATRPFEFPHGLQNICNTPRLDIILCDYLTLAVAVMRLASRPLFAGIEA